MCARRPASARQAGSGSVLAVAVLAASLGLVSAAVPLYSVLAERSRVVGAADAAALAAADTASGARPGVPCEAAALVAEANGTRLDACRADGLVVTVRVEASVLRLAVTAVATAGPPGSR
ncbi:MAG: hypothetical protein QM635_06970 [Microbacteriaceae bacterium]